MNYWFTADTHFGHANIIKYCNRPFKDTVEMNETIISNWNKVVGDDDLVYHLGDFCFARHDYEVDSYLKRLNGLIVFIKGNHDKLTWKLKNKFYAAYDSYHDIELNEQKITLCHYKMAIWNRSHRGAWHLYGHSHGSVTNSPHDLSFDCGVDCHNFTPINFEQVKQIMSKKLWKPIDHHGDIQESGGIGLSKVDYEKLDRKRQYEQLKQEFDAQYKEREVHNQCMISAFGEHGQG